MNKSETGSTQTVLGLIALAIILGAMVASLNFLKSSPTAAWSAVGAVTMGMTGLIGTNISNRSAQSVQVRQEQIAIKQKLYEEINIFFIQFLYSSSNAHALSEPPQDMGEFMQNITPRLSLYASEEVLCKFREFMQSAFTGGGGMLLMGLYEELIFCMRRDLGHRSAHHPGDVLGLFITDLEHCLNLIAKERQAYRPPTILDTSPQ